MPIAQGHHRREGRRFLPPPLPLALQEPNQKSSAAGLVSAKALLRGLEHRTNPPRSRSRGTAGFLLLRAIASPGRRGGLCTRLSNSRRQLLRGPTLFGDRFTGQVDQPFGAQAMPSGQRRLLPAAALGRIGLNRCKLRI